MEVEAELARLRLRPGDAVTVRTQQPLSDRAAARIGARVAEALAEAGVSGVEVVVLPAGVMLEPETKPKRRRWWRRSS